jgi:uncharacterized protein (DUF302 family)
VVTGLAAPDAAGHQFLPLTDPTELTTKGSTMSDQLSFSTTVTCPFDEAVTRTRGALAAQGFGVLTEIDVTATMRTKIGAELEDFLILGACKPDFAYRALEASRAVGLMMPCNVVIRRDREDGGIIHVEAVNPALMVSFVGAEGSEGADGVREVAEDAAAWVSAAIASLADA